MCDIFRGYAYPTNEDKIFTTFLRKKKKEETKVMRSLAPALTLTLTQTFSLNYSANKQLRSSYSLQRQKFILGVYSRTADFKDLSAVATMPDHQSNKTCRRWDSFQCPRLLQYVKIENHVQKYIVRITFFRLLVNEKTITCPSIGIAYEPIHAAAVTKFGQRRSNTWLADLPAS